MSQISRTLGVALNIGIHAWYQRMVPAERARAVESGWSLTVADAEDDADRQQQQLFDMLDDGVDAILLSAVRATELAAPLDRCVELGVPVVTESIEVDHPAVVAEVRVDDVAAGVALGEAMADIVDLSEPIALMSVGFSALSEAHDRERGFLEGLRRRHPELTVWYVEGLAQVELVRAAVTRNLVERGSPRPDVIFGVDDESIVGAVEALADLGHATPPTATYGITPPSGIELLERGTLTVGAAMFAENHGRTLVDLALAAATGDEHPRMVNPPSAVVTARSGPLPWTRFYEEHGDALSLRWSELELLS